MGTLNKVLWLVGFSELIGVSTPSQTLDLPPVPENMNAQLAALSKKALTGDTKSELRMGLAYEFGQGTDKNIENAMRWYRLAANKGDPVAQTGLRYLYETGGNGQEHPTEAAKWYLRAAVSGFTRAKFNLGVLFLKGKSVQRSAEEAAHWIGEAAEDGCPSAILALSYLYENGTGVSSDPQKALELKRMAAKKNKSNPCMSLIPRPPRTAVARASFANDEPMH